MTIRTTEGVWIVPPLRAVWIPDNVVHSIQMSGDVSMRTLYFARKFVKVLPRHCFVMNVSPLLRELILHACQSTRLTTKLAKEKRVIELIVDQLDSRNMIPLQLPLPADQRAKRITDTLIANPGDQRPLEQLCDECGASKRTIERLFQDQTQMTFGKWRQLLRMLHAITMLASGEKVVNVALETGYNSPSAFISAFRKILGTTPGNYCEAEPT
jgi:AraC-like DNA-binding protein